MADAGLDQSVTGYPVDTTLLDFCSDDRAALLHRHPDDNPVPQPLVIKCAVIIFFYFLLVQLLFNIGNIYVYMSAFTI